MGEMKASKKRGVPTGRTAIREAERKRENEIVKLAAFFKENDENSEPAFLVRVGMLVKRGVQIPPKEILREGLDRWNVDVRALWRAWEECFNGKGFAVVQPFSDELSMRDDAACEMKWELMPGDAERWQNEHPGRSARPGEVFRWLENQQEKADAERGTKVLKEQATEIAWRDRDKVLPCPDDEEFLRVLETWQRIDWKDRYQWPTVNRVRQCLAMPRKEILKIAKSGRWGPRDVIELPQRTWRGVNLPEGSNPPRLVEAVNVAKPPEAHLSPCALAKVLRRFAAKHISLKANALALAKALYKK